MPPDACNSVNLQAGSLRIRTFKNGSGSCVRCESCCHQCQYVPLWKFFQICYCGRNSRETEIRVGITTNEASDLMSQIRTLKDKVERLMI